MPLSYRNLFSIHKKQYIKAHKNNSECILCAIVQNRCEGANLAVADGKLCMICVNKFPYNSGHLLIFPKRHITDYRDMRSDEESETNALLRQSIDVLEGLYAPAGFNIGYNIGDFAGASIPHLHMHVIPRYKNELGFIDIIGGAKIVIEDPSETMAKLKEAFSRMKDRL